MKYCKHCGTQLMDEAIVCTNCGCATESHPAKTETSGLKIATKIFMILGCISTAFCFLIPLCWTIPMTVHYCKSVDNNTSVGIGFKICSLLFVNIIAGILMLCDSDKKSA